MDQPIDRKRPTRHQRHLGGRDRSQIIIGNLRFPKKM